MFQHSKSGDSFHSRHFTVTSKQTKPYGQKQPLLQVQKYFASEKLFIANALQDAGCEFVMLEILASQLHFFLHTWK